MNWKRLYLCVLWLCTAVCSLAVAAGLEVNDHSPDALVRTLSHRVLADLQAQPLLKKDAHKALAYAEKVVVPYFDFSRMTRLAIGQSWRTATPQQREALTTAFKSLLLRTYIVAFSRYNNQQIRIDKSLIHGHEALVHSTIVGLNMGNSSDVDVQYRLIDEQGHWKMFDVSVAGISLVLNYRPQFQQQIRTEGIDSLIAALKNNSEQLSR